MQLVGSAAEMALSEDGHLWAGEELAFRVNLTEQTVRCTSADGARCSPKKW